MNSKQRRERFRAILEGNQCVHPAGIFDPISARIAEDLGFELLILSRHFTSAAVLGAPDMGLLTLTELTEQARRICRACNISVTVDGENGYGNALSVMRTVEELENAGVAGLTIEDTLLPQTFGNDKRVGNMQGPISLEEAVGKMKAALAARRDSSLVIAAGIAAPSIAGLDETVRRARAFERLGIDLLHVRGARTRQEVVDMHNATRTPLVVMTAAGGDLTDNDFLAANGVRVALQGNPAIQSAIKAVHDTLKALRDGKSPSDLRATLASPELVAHVTRQADYNRYIKEYLN